MDRWALKNKKDVESGSKTASHLAVQYPADLSWKDVTCHVLDQKTLKQKQVSLADSRSCPAPNNQRPLSLMIFVIDLDHSLYPCCSNSEVATDKR